MKISIEKDVQDFLITVGYIQKLFPPSTFETPTNRIENLIQKIKLENPLYLEDMQNLVFSLAEKIPPSQRDFVINTLDIQLLTTKEHLKYLKNKKT